MTQEKEIKTLNGWMVVPFVIAGYALALYALIQFILEAIQADKLHQMPSFTSLCIALVLLVATFIVNMGLFPFNLDKRVYVSSLETIKER